MTSFTTANTVKILSALGKLEFRALNNNDRACFADAGADAQIAFNGVELATLICEITGESIPTDYDAIAVLVSDGIVELHTGTIDGDCVCIGFNLDRLI